MAKTGSLPGCTSARSRRPGYEAAPGMSAPPAGGPRVGPDPASAAGRVVIVTGGSREFAAAPPAAFAAAGAAGVALGARSGGRRARDHNLNRTGGVTLPV